MGTLPQECTVFQVKQTFMRHTAITTRQNAPGREAMLAGNLEQVLIIRLLCGIENDADVHHYVDKQAFRRDKRR